jgi:hypothetical protein
MMSGRASSFATGRYGCVDDPEHQRDPEERDKFAGIRDAWHEARRHPQRSGVDQQSNHEAHELVLSSGRAGGDRPGTATGVMFYPSSPGVGK